MGSVPDYDVIVVGGGSGGVASAVGAAEAGAHTRHIVSPHPLTGHHVLSGSDSLDAIAVGTWPSEYHPGSGRPSEWAFVGGKGYYDIPLGLLRSLDTENLFAAGRVLDADHHASASLRVMGTAFATGHAAGIAAALSTDRQTVDAARVRHELRRQDARLRDSDR
jgi:hypothetical protein